MSQDNIYVVELFDLKQKSPQKISEGFIHMQMYLFIQEKIESIAADA